ncbi:S8 family serine peptidase [Methylomonas montana]|uniref:S8 family serine peptidase n=1 Tax=Methylomonas montana TaxID=3058963 RepID=UPI002658B23A|nr:S8 family serine peptidase [Methylomonas montana]WKJ89433.1 S8 family serine peptidase [Methylomonas montana]
MKRRNLYILGSVLLAVPAVIYLNKYLEEHFYESINKDIAEHPTAAGPLKTWKAGQILVQPKAGLPAAEFEKIVKGHQGKVAEKIGNLPVHIISVPDHAEEAVVRALSKNPHIEFAELDMDHEMSATPNDPLFGSAWHLPKIQAPTAWDVANAAGITIAILDTGVEASHPDLANQMVPGVNAVDSGADTSDIESHGTQVAGSAAAAFNNGVGVAGIAGNAKIMPVRITNRTDGVASTSDITRGLNWAADNGADVANISYAVSGSSSVTTAAQYMRGKGGVVVVAAGNSGIDPGYANNQYMITVSATGGDDVKAGWSNYGAVVDVAAPGVSIQTTSVGGSYAAVSGTSFASPVTAGVVALIQSANLKLTPDQVEKVLESSADKVSGVDFDPNYGYGRINAAAAVQLAINTTAVDSQAPTASITSPSGGSVVSGIASVTVNAADNVAVSQVSLFANGKLVGTDTTAPYQFSWDTSAVANGNVSLTATATDAAGNNGSAASVTVSVQNQTSATITDQAAPTVAISNPVGGAKVSGVVGVSVAANDDVAIAKVQLSIDGKLMAVTTNKTLSYNWNTKKASAGSHSLQATATDTANKTSTVTVQVTK